VRSLLASSDVAARPLGRLAALPAASRDMVEMMACLGGRAELGVLAAATGQSADVVERHLAPALGNGVLVAETGAHDAVRFRHDRIREAVLAKLDTQQRRSLQLALARQLAATPELVAVAAQQYLPVIEAITDAAERSHVLALLRRAAEQASISVPVSRTPVQTGRTRRTESVERQQLSDPLGYGETTSSTI
jgi:predicted ATPase